MNRNVALLVGLASLVLNAPQARGLTVTPLQGPSVSIDAGAGLTSTYVGFGVTNNDGTDHADLWVSLESFSGPVIAPAPTDDGQHRIGPLAMGETKPAYFYLAVPAETVGPETFSLRVYDAVPGVGALLHDESFQLQSFETLSAAANKVLTIVSFTSAPIGGTVQVTVVGETGVVGVTGDYAVTPAAVPSWPADVFELAGVHVEFRTVDCITPLFAVDDELHAALTPGLEYCYEATYAFRVRGTSAGPIQVSPVAYVSSGAQIKHNPLDCGGPYICDLVPPLNHATIEKSVAPSSLPAGGAATYTVTLGNAATSDIVLDDAIDLLPVVPAAGSYVPGSAKYDGVPIVDPAEDGAMLTFVGPFVVPAGGSRALTYDVTLPSDPGVYMNEAVGLVGGLQIDATLGLEDDVPAQASVTVGGVLPGAAAPGLAALAALLALAGVRVARRRRRA